MYFFSILKMSIVKTRLLDLFLVLNYSGAEGQLSLYKFLNKRVNLKKRKKKPPLK